MKLRTISEAATALGISVRQLRQGIAAGIYPSVRWGNRRLVDLDVLAPLIEAERQREAADEVVGLRECAEAIGVSPDALRRMALAGLVPCRREGRYYRFRVQAVEQAIRDKMR